MGCVQAKPSSSSPERLRIEKLKADQGYAVGGVGAFNGRRSVGLPPVVREDEGKGGAGARRDTSVLEIRMKMDDEMVDGWPRWLVNNIPKGVLAGLVPKSADSYEMIGKVGQGSYSNVYKARDKDTGRIVALKKVRFDTSESDSVRFMAREIMILQRLDHPNVLKFEGLATSRMQYSLYLVFEYMQSDLARVISCCPGRRLTELQVKCYMRQLLSGLQHCHEKGILHRDIKGSNLLIDKHGVLKLGDFGLANFLSPNQKRRLTSRVVTLWYRAPELLLGSTDYGVGIDLWSAGCLLAEMFAGQPVMPGRTEIEQLHRIFKLCGSPPEEYWRKLKLSTSFRPPKPYESSILEAFQDFPSASLGLLTTLLSLDPSSRGSAASALQSEFFSMNPLAYGLSDLPVIYGEESDDSAQPGERRKRILRIQSCRQTTPQLKQRSQSQIEMRMKLKQIVELAKADYRSSTEDDKSGDLIVQSLGLSSIIASSSSSSKSSNYAFTSSQSPSPMSAATLAKISPSTEYHRSSTKNSMNLPPCSGPKIPNVDGDDEGFEGFECRPGLERSTSMPNAFRLARDLMYKHYEPGA